MANFSDPQYKANFGFQMVSLPNPTVNQSFQLKSYEKAAKIGYSPKVESFSCGFNYVDVAWTNRTQHRNAASLYSQKNIDCVYDNIPDLRYAVNSTVSSFKEHSELETGLIINFIAV